MGEEKLSAPLQEWANQNSPERALPSVEVERYDRYWHTILFVRDTAPLAISWDVAEVQAMQASMRVIATHTSRSTLIPVVQMTLPDRTILTIANNFGYWLVSVHSRFNVMADATDIFDPAHDHRESPEHCGIPGGLMFGPYAKNKRQFTVRLAANEELFLFLWVFFSRRPRHGQAKSA